MSLINDVLKDLERRGSTSDVEQSTTPGRRPLPSRKRWHWAAWGLAALATGALLHLSLEPYTGHPPSISEPVLTAQASDTGDRARQPGQTAEAAAEAEQAAADRSSEARSSDPADRGATGRPPTMVERPIQSVETDSSSDTRAAETESATGTDRSAVKPARATPELAQNRSTESRPEPTATATEENDEAGESAEGTISIERAGDPELETDPIVAARRLIAQGRYGRAEARLRALLAERPGDSAAYELLARTLVTRGRARQADALLQESLTKADRTQALAMLFARRLIDRGEIHRARSVLADHAPEMSADPDYHLLLAAAHRQTGDHAAAAAHYRRLSELLPSRGTVWVGLGASLEALDRNGEALAAYREALNGDDDRAAAFARSRLRALETKTGTDP
jgi:tetratricopeptide (TPR) repeat protein